MFPGIVDTFQGQSGSAPGGEKKRERDQVLNTLNGSRRNEKGTF